MKQVLRNKDKGNFIERYFKSFCHALSGIWYALKYEHNMIIMLIATIVVVTSGLYFKISIYEWLFCIMAIGCVIATELINTAIEAVVDLETTKVHPLAKIAKDTAGAASLVYCIVALVGGLIIFIPKIIEIL